MESVSESGTPKVYTGRIIISSNTNNSVSLCSYKISLITRFSAVIKIFILFYVSSGQAIRSISVLIGQCSRCMLTIIILTLVGFPKTVVARHSQTFQSKPCPQETPHQPVFATDETSRLGLSPPDLLAQVVCK